MQPSNQTWEQAREYPVRHHGARSIQPKFRPVRPEKEGALSIQPKSPEISFGSSNGTYHFGLVRPEYSGPALKVVHCDRSGHFGRSDRNVPFHLPKLLSPVPLFSIRLTRTSSFQFNGKWSAVSKVWHLKWFESVAIFFDFILFASNSVK